MIVEKLRLTIKNTDHVTNCYIVYDEQSKEAVIIDPADEVDVIERYIISNDLIVKYIFLTHAHFDHVNGLHDIQKFTNSPVVINENEFNMLMLNISNASEFFNLDTKTIDEKNVIRAKNHDIIKMKNLDFELINTPGHTEGSMIIYEKNNNMLFTGDTLFSKEYGRCDLESGDFSKMVRSLKYIFNTFDENTIFYPGHGRESKLCDTKKYISLLIAMKGDNIN